MKKVIIFLLMMIIPLSVHAYGIDKYNMEITILDNGDIEVNEDFSLNGDYNGFERIINYKNSFAKSFDGTLQSFYGSDIYNGSGISLKSVKGLRDGMYIPFSESESAKVGNSNVYTITSTSYGAKYKIFNPSKNGMDFVLNYVIKDVAVVHNDVAELYWNIFSDELTESVGTYKLVISIPGNVNELKAWAHGPLNGNVNIIDKNKVEVTLYSLEQNEPMDVRLVFDKNVLANSDKKSGINGLENILAIEQIRANEANEKREAINEQNEISAKQCVDSLEKNLDRNLYDTCTSYVNYLLDGELKTSLNDRMSVALVKIEKKEQELSKRWFGLLGLWGLSLVVLICYAYVKHDKEYRSSFKQKYLRDFPNTYGPEIVKYLMNKDISGDSLSASIVNLIAKKVISYEALNDDYKLIYNPEVASKTELSESEKILLNWFFEKMVTDNDLTLEEIKSAAKKKYNSFLTNFSKWKSAVEEESSSYNFFEEKTGIRLLLLLFSGLGVTFLFWIPNTEIASNIMFIIMAIIVGTWFYAFAISKRTVFGNEEYSKWMALSNFLHDFGNFKDRDLPHISLWEKYLVYAMVFGCAKQLSKTMKLKIESMDINNQDSSYVTTVLHMRTMNTVGVLINNAIVSSVSAATSARTSASSNNWSSGSGMGGGFSGGGGFGGGGGGGGRF